MKGGKQVGEYCNKASLTPLRESLVRGMMQRGMILEIDHLPQRAYARVFEMMEEHQYPAAGTHGGHNGGKLYALGGVSKGVIKNCRASNRPGALLSSISDRTAATIQSGGYPAVGLGFDLNGFAGAPGGRFGAQSSCKDPQVEPVTIRFSPTPATSRSPNHASGGA